MGHTAVPNNGIAGQGSMMMMMKTYFFVRKAFGFHDFDASVVQKPFHHLYHYPWGQIFDKLFWIFLHVLAFCYSRKFLNRKTDGFAFLSLLSFFFFLLLINQRGFHDMHLMLHNLLLPRIGVVLVHG